MSEPRLESLLRHARRARSAQDGHSVADAELLQRFVRQRDEAAFELLLRRHERMVFGVCLRFMRDATEAEDVFQATFLTLVCKAHTIARGQSVAAWLHRVACRAARRGSVEALSRAARRLRDARLDLSPAAAEQLKCREDYLEFAKLIEFMVQRDAMPPCEGDLPRLSMEDYEIAQLARLDAEIDLLRARRKAQPPGPK
jgi:DNA-directed RNA polymerase specialized sigma24 family protein